MRLSILMVSLISLTARGDQIDLAGPWSFQLDRQDQGEAGKWFERDLSDRISLPGVLTAQGYGDPTSMQTQWTGGINPVWQNDPYYKQYQTPENFKMPFWLQPDRHYVGSAWYQRQIDVPRDWTGKRVVLFLERPHWKTTAWLDGREIGSQDSLGTPHTYDLGTNIAPGKHRLTIRVDNRMIVDVGRDAHSISDHTQGNWNGIAGRIELRTTDPVWVEDVRVYPRIKDQTVDVTVSIGNATGEAGEGSLAIIVPGKGHEYLHVPVSWTAEGGEAKCTYSMRGDCRPWDEFEPTLYTMQVHLAARTPKHANKGEQRVRFGMREVGTEGTRITINGKPTFIRGTLECCIFPLTGHPPADVGSWKRVISTCKAHGLNHIRFHSWCPPEAAFIAADELGFYFHVECSAWATVGSGGPFDKWLYKESEAMVKAYGNHPSFVMMAYGNEPNGRNHVQFLSDFVTYWKQRDSRRLYTTAAGWPIVPQSDYYSTPAPRIQQWGQGVQSRVNARPPETMTDYSDFVQKNSGAPTISHEIGQWCVYPNFDEMKKYKGLLKAKNFEIFREQLDRNGMLDQAHDFLMASGKLQTLLYKEDIESALRTPGFGGFQLLDLHDFPGQGTALVGVLDPFWDSKGYVTAEQYRRFAGPIVPLARLEQRIFKAGDTLHARIDLAHFGRDDLKDVKPQWWLNDSSGDTVARGELPQQTIKTGTLSTLGEVNVKLDGLKRAEKLNLVVRIPHTEAANDWDIWVFPNELPAERANDVLVTREMNDEAARRLAEGGKVLLLPPAATIRNDEKHPITMGFSSIFWNTVWTNWQPPHTLGILCDPKHPALARFPTEYHSNWQWQELMHNAAPFILTEHRDLQPVVQVIDDWVTARKLALVFEARVGKGRLLACSCDLVNDLDNRLVARQMRHSLLTYMAGDRFDPKYVMTPEQLTDLWTKPTAMQKLGVTATADNSHPSHTAEMAIDNNRATIWHTHWGPMAQPPHYLVLDLKQSVRVFGITYLPRQDMTNGRIARYEVYVSGDGENWGKPAAEGTWPNDAAVKTVRFAEPQNARFVKLVALSEVREQPFASAAEVGIVLE